MIPLPLLSYIKFLRDQETEFAQYVGAVRIQSKHLKVKQENRDLKRKKHTYSKSCNEKSNESVMKHAQKTEHEQHEQHEQHELHCNSIRARWNPNPQNYINLESK